MAKSKIAGESGLAPEIERFDVVLAAPRSFHLFVQDEQDEWAVSIEQVNKGTYDPLKLKRISFYLDVGLPHGNPMAFGFDGSMIVPRNPHLRSADDAIDEFNRVVAALLIGGLAFPQVKSDHLAFGSLLSTGYYRYEIAHGVLLTLHQAWGEGSAGTYMNIELYEPKRISKSDVVSAFNLGRPVLESIYSVDPSTLVMAFSFHSATEYRNSLLYSWLIIEQIIVQIWNDDFIKNIKSKWNERIGQLKSISKNISVRIEFLSEMGLIDRKLYRYLQRARNARNDLIHKGLKPNEGDSYFSLFAVARLIETICSKKEQ